MNMNFNEIIAETKNKIDNAINEAANMDINELLVSMKNKAGNAMQNTMANFVGKNEEAVLWLKNAMSRKARNDSASAPRTRLTLSEYFQQNNLPSPPHKDAEVVNIILEDAHKILDIVRPDWRQMRDSDDPLVKENISKLVYAVGKGFFDHLLVHPGENADENDIKLHQIKRHLAQLSADMIIIDRHDLLVHPGQDADEHDIEEYRILLALARNSAKKIINPRNKHGGRYHAFFSVDDAEDRVWTLEENNSQDTGVHSYEYYVENRLHDVKRARDVSPDDIFELFNDENKPDFKPQYRVQEAEDCFAQAPILAHFYLQLFYHPSLRKDEAFMVDLSRFMRNFYHGEEFYEYIMEKKGGLFEAVFGKVLYGDYSLPPEYGDKQFEEYVEMLKKHGPAVVKMFHGGDLQEDNKWVYEGEPSPCPNEKKSGHAMLLVGVIRAKHDIDSYNAGDDIYFILQNFWYDKQFMLVRRDYFRASSLSSHKGERASIFFVQYNSQFQCAEPETIFANPARHDVSLSSHLHDRPSAAKNMFRVRSVSHSTGQGYTRWV